MILASQLRIGIAVRYQGHAYKVVAAEYHPGQGKMGGVTHARLQNFDTGTFWEHSFRSDLRFEEIPLEKHTLEFSYWDGDECYFMDGQTFEQHAVAKALIGPGANLLEPGMSVSVEFLEDRVISIAFPDVLEVKIADTAPPSHQQDNTFKPAKLANGIEIMVPQFIKSGEVVRLDVNSLKYIERAKTEPKGKAAQSGKGKGGA